MTYPRKVTIMWRARHCGRRGADEPPRGACRCGGGPDACICGHHAPAGHSLAGEGPEYLRGLKADLERELRRVDERLAALGVEGSGAGSVVSGGSKEDDG